MAVGIFFIAVVLCLIVAVSCFNDARNADSDHPFNSYTDKRDQ